MSGPVIQSSPRWSAEERAAAAQRQKLTRFLIESAMFSGRQLQEDLSAITGGKSNAYLDAQAAGYPPRPWLGGNGMQSAMRWRYPAPPKPKPEPSPRPPLPGVSLTDISRVLGLSRERVRQHAGRPGFPLPLPLSVTRNGYDPDQIERYYRDCQEAFTAYLAAGVPAGRGLGGRRANGRFKVSRRDGVGREVRLDLPIHLDPEVWAEVVAYVHANHPDLANTAKP